MDPFNALKAANRLPTPPNVAMRIIQLIESEHTSLDDLAQVIGSDPALTSKILKFMKSPLVGLGFHGSTLAEAVARIGMRGAQMLALSFSLVSQKHQRHCPSFNFDRFWSESLARAVAARCVATALGGWDPDEAFITGLVCRIGQLVFATGCPNEYEIVLRYCENEDLPLLVREKETFGTDHLEISVRLLKEWQVPAVLWKTVDSLTTGVTDDTTKNSNRIMHMADIIAVFIATEDEHTTASLAVVEGIAGERIGIQGADFRNLIGKIGHDWIHYGRLLSVQTNEVPDVEAIERVAEEHRTTLRLASEIEVQDLRVANQQLSHSARIDKLTSLLNRSAFEGEMQSALKKAEANLQPLTLILIDADRFKSINDTHGHPTGDSALRHLARTIDDNVRKRDQVFRYGGEEFAVIARDCPEASAMKLAESLRAAVESTPFDFGNLSIPLTISLGIGVAKWPENPGTIESLVDFADERLYDAKHGGRNAWSMRPGVVHKTGRGIVAMFRQIFRRKAG